MNRMRPVPTDKNFSDAWPLAGDYMDKAAAKGLSPRAQIAGATASYLAALDAGDAMLEALKECRMAEDSRRRTLKPGAPSHTYTVARLARIDAAIAKAEGR